MVILVPVVLLTMLFVVQFALAYHARQVLAGAAHDAAAAAARRDSNLDAGQALAEQMIGDAAGSLLDSYTVTASAGPGTVTIEAAGEVVSLIPFFGTITVSATGSAQDRNVRPARRSAVSHRRPARCRDDRGSAGVEAALAVIALLAVGYFIIGALRIVGTGGDAKAAAHAAARAAAAEYDAGSAEQAAAAVASEVLGERGVACKDLSVSVGGDFSPGGIVTVDVSCTVNLADVALAGFPGKRTVTGRGVEQIDVVRGGTP